jgi:adenine-specific DNA-methyltransferase
LNRASPDIPLPLDTFSAKGALVLDPFAGSGSSLAATRMLGRDYLRIELGAEYHTITCQRLGMTSRVPDQP